MPLLKDKNDSITGATDGTLIGNVGDSLKVNVTGGSVNPAPSVTLVESTEYLAESGGNKSMDVNGSSTPRVFFAEVPVGQTWYIHSVMFYFTDGSIDDRNDFGNISGGLSNGLLTEFEISSTDYPHSNIQNNMELGLVFETTNDGGDANNTLAADDPAWFGEARFKEVVCLQAGDRIKTTVRDNLNPLTDQRMAVRFWRAI